jgi:hypothetical protein
MMVPRNRTITLEVPEILLLIVQFDLNLHILVKSGFIHHFIIQVVLK